MAKAELADIGPMRGTMVIRPVRVLDLGADAGRDGRPDQGVRGRRTPTSRCSSQSRTGHREAEHVDGFSTELAVVTHAGGNVGTTPQTAPQTTDAEHPANAMAFVEG